MTSTRDEQDAKLTIYNPMIDAEQAAYFGEHGSYKNMINYNGELDIHVLSTTNNQDINGYLVLAYAWEGDNQYFRRRDTTNQQTVDSWTLIEQL